MKTDTSSTAITTSVHWEPTWEERMAAFFDEFLAGIDPEKREELVRHALEVRTARERDYDGGGGEG